MPRRDNGANERALVVRERKVDPQDLLVGPPAKPRQQQPQVPTLPKLPLKDIQRGAGGGDSMMVSRTKSQKKIEQSTSHSVYGAPDAVSTDVADNSIRGRNNTTTKVARTARADLGYSLVSGSSAGALETTNGAPVTDPASGLGENYVHDLKARMKMIGGVVAKSNRIDPISAWPLALPVSGVNERLTSGTGRIILNSSCRPPLALEIESFIRKEVQNLTRVVPKPSILQLIPIYREAFGCFITHFNEYAPTLSLIQKHYDAAIDSLGILQQRVDKTQTELFSLKETFHIMVEQEKRTLHTGLTDVKLQLNAQLKLDVDRKKQFLELEHLLNRVTEAKKDRDAEFEDCYDRNRSLASQMREQQTKSAKLVTKCDRLVVDNDRLLKHVASIESRLIGGEAIDFTDEAARKKERAVALQRKTVSMMKNNKKANKEASDGASETGEEPESPISPGAKKNEIEVDNIDDLREILYEKEAEHKKLLKVNALLVTETQVLESRIDKLQQSKDEDILTPRPRWVSATEALPNFTPNQLQTSEEILDDLIRHFKERLREDTKAVEMKAYSATVRQWLSEEDLMEGDLVGKGKNFVCKGTGPHVPLYLRFKGLTKNQRMKKGDVENLLARFWQDRRTRIRADSQLGAQPIEEFFYEWLRKETPSHKHAINLAYNMLAVCEANQQDPDCSMILRVLGGEISEMAVFDQFDLVLRLKEVVQHHDKQKKGAITRVTFQRILNKFFPAKSIDDMLHLRFALIRFCQGSNVVDYEALFNEDEEGNQTQFVEMMRTQHMHEIASFVVEVEEAIREVINVADGTVAFGSARTGVKFIDSAMPSYHIDEMLAYGCKMTLDELMAHGEHFSVPAEPLLARIRTGVLLKRHTRREVDSDASSSDEEDAEDEDGEGEDAEGAEESVNPDDDGSADSKSITASVEHKERVKRRKKIDESGIARAQRKEEIKELLRDLNIDETGERNADIPSDRRAKITTNKDGEVSVLMPSGFDRSLESIGGKLELQLPNVGPGASTSSPLKKSVMASPFAGKRGSNPSQGQRSAPVIGERSSSVVVLAANSPTLDSGIGGNSNPTLARSFMMNPEEEEKEAERQRKREQQERKASMAEAQLAEQEGKMKTRRDNDDKEVTEISQWSSKFGVSGVNVDNLKAAKKVTKEMEESQAKSFHWEQVKDAPVEA